MVESQESTAGKTPQRFGLPVASAAAAPPAGASKPSSFPARRQLVANVPKGAFVEGLTGHKLFLDAAKSIREEEVIATLNIDDEKRDGGHEGERGKHVKGRSDEDRSTGVVQSLSRCLSVKDSLCGALVDFNVVVFVVPWEVSESVQFDDAQNRHFWQWKVTDMRDRFATLRIYCSRGGGDEARTTGRRGPHNNSTERGAGNRTGGGTKEDMSTFPLFELWALSNIRVLPSAAFSNSTSTSLATIPPKSSTSASGNVANDVNYKPDRVIYIDSPSDRLCVGPLVTVSRCLGDSGGGRACHRPIDASFHTTGLCDVCERRLADKQKRSDSQVTAMMQRLGKRRSMLDPFGPSVAVADEAAAATRSSKKRRARDCDENDKVDGSQCHDGNGSGLDGDGASVSNTGKQHDMPGVATAPAARERCGTLVASPSGRVRYKKRRVGSAQPAAAETVADEKVSTKDNDNADDDDAEARVIQLFTALEALSSVALPNIGPRIRSPKTASVTGSSTRTCVRGGQTSRNGVSRPARRSAAGRVAVLVDEISRLKPSGALLCRPAIAALCPIAVLTLLASEYRDTETGEGLAALRTVLAFRRKRHQRTIKEAQQTSAAPVERLLDGAQQPSPSSSSLSASASAPPVLQKSNKTNPSSCLPTLSSAIDSAIVNLQRVTEGKEPLAPPAPAETNRAQQQRQTGDSKVAAGGGARAPPPVKLLAATMMTEGIEKSGGLEQRIQDCLNKKSAIDHLI